MNGTDRSAELALAEEANREAWKMSLFWDVDHPTEEALRRGQRIPKPTAPGLLEGVREALANAERMLAVTRKRMDRLGEVIAESSYQVKPALRPYISNAITGVVKSDVRRARSEVEHWKEYVQHFEKQTWNAPVLRIDGLVGEILEAKGLKT